MKLLFANIIFLLLITACSGSENTTHRSNDNGEIDPNSKLGERLAWALTKADELDPMTDSPPSLKEQIRELGYYC